MSDQNTSFPVRTQNDGDLVTKLCDATIPSQQLTIDSLGRLVVKLDDGAGNIITSQVNGTQRALDVGVNVAGVQVDPRAIRALTASDVVQANIKDATGTAFGATNPLPIYITEAPGTKVQDYATATVAAAATSNHDYTVPATKTLVFSQVAATASGKAKFELQQSQDGSTFTTVAVLFNSTANPNADLTLSEPVVVPTGGKIRVIRTNKDLTAQDLYSTIVGFLF